MNTQSIKKIFIPATIFILIYLLAGCESLSSTNVRSSKKVEINIEYTMMVQINETPSNKYKNTQDIQPIKDSFSYDDDLIHITLAKPHESYFDFTLLNKSNETAEINWDEIVYVDYLNASHPVRHGAYYNSMTDRNQPQLPARIISGTSINDSLIMIDAFFRQKYYDLKHGDTYESFRKYAESLQGRSLKLHIPIKFGQKSLRYTFIFNINTATTPPRF